MKLPADRVSAVAFRAGESTHQVDDGHALGVRARRQSAMEVFRREMPGITLLHAATAAREQLCRKIIVGGAKAKQITTDPGGTPSGPCHLPLQLFALLT